VLFICGRFCFSKFNNSGTANRCQMTFLVCAFMIICKHVSFCYFIIITVFIAILLLFLTLIHLRCFVFITIVQNCVNPQGSWHGEGRRRRHFKRQASSDSKASIFYHANSVHFRTSRTARFGRQCLDFIQRLIISLLDVLMWI